MRSFGLLRLDHLVLLWLDHLVLLLSVLVTYTKAAKSLELFHQIRIQVLSDLLLRTADITLHGNFVVTM